MQQQAMALFKSIEWQEGPAMPGSARSPEIKIPEGYRFTGRTGRRSGRS